MATKQTNYRDVLAALPDWEAFLRAESGLPGPRANLELIYAAAELAGRERIEDLLAFLAADAAGGSPGNSPEVFLGLCGVVALGRLLADGDRSPLARLRQLANDARWRVREGVAMALQRWGDADLPGLLAESAAWAGGSLLEQRAIAAALCEPRLLRDAPNARAVLALLDEITRRLAGAPAAERKGEAFQALRKGLGYCWSVAVAARPEEGKRAFEAWAGCADRDVQWVLRENLKKNRLARMDAAWVGIMGQSMEASKHE